MQKSDKDSSVAFQVEFWDFGWLLVGWRLPSQFNIFMSLCFLILFRRWATGRSSRGCFAPFHLKATCTHSATWWRRCTPLLYQTTVCQHAHLTWRVSLIASYISSAQCCCMSCCDHTNNNNTKQYITMIISMSWRIMRPKYLSHTKRLNYARHYQQLAGRRTAS